MRSLSSASAAVAAEDKMTTGIAIRKISAAIRGDLKSPSPSIPLPMEEGSAPFSSTAHRSPFSDLLARPEHSLAAGRNGTDALVDKLLHPLSFVGLGGVEVPLGIGGDAVYSVELAGLAPAVAEVGELLHGLAQDDPHLLVLAVGEEHEALLRILRKRDVPRRSRPQRLPGVPLLLHELAFRREHLHAIALAVAHVDEVIVRTLDAVHRVAELLRRHAGVVVALGGIVGLVAVRAPVALHLAGVGVDHRHTLVPVAVGDIGLVGLGIDPDLGHAPEVLQV